MHFPLIMPSTQDTHLPIPGIFEFVRIRTVLVWAAITEYHKLDGLNNRNFSQFRRMGSPRSRHWRIKSKIWCLVRACLLVHRWPLFRCVLTWQKKGKIALWGPDYKSINTEFPGGLVVKDLALLLQWQGFDPWPGNFRMLWPYPPAKKRAQIPFTRAPLSWPNFLPKTPLFLKKNLI